MTADACTGGSWDADNAHAAERWSKCCLSRLDTRIPEVQRRCPTCGDPVAPDEAVRWS